MILRSFRPDNMDANMKLAVARIRTRRSRKGNRQKLVAIYPRNGVRSDDYDYYWAGYTAWDYVNHFFRCIARPQYFRT